MANPETIQRIQDTAIRHRIEEAAMLVAAASRVLSDIPRIAGPTNGTAKLVEARSADALALAQTLEANARELRPRSGVEITERAPDPERVRAINEAREAV